MAKILKYSILASVLFATPVAAECVLKETTNAKQLGTIESVRNITKNVVPWRENKQKCMVSFEAQVDGNWHQGLGSYVFHKDEGKACAVAYETGKKLMLEELYPQQIRSKAELVCDDSNKEKDLTGLEGLSKISGNRFVYQGKTCDRYFETVVEGRDLYQWTVIMCQLRPNRWVEMDRY